MKASIYNQYGSANVLHLSDVAKPTPRENEVLINVHASTVTAADIMMREGKPAIGRLYLGLKRPKRPILGFEFAGEIVECGSGVTSFRVGDKVFGGTTTLGCYAEYVCVSADDVITHIPDTVSFEQAAPVSGSAVTVMNFLRGLAKINKTHSVLIYGASGGVGTFAVQIAKYFGAEVTGVCSAANVGMVRSLGADNVIDYTKEDFAKNGKRYDIIFDTVGKLTPAQCMNSLNDNGIYLSTVMSFALILRMIFTPFFGKKQAKSSSTGMLPANQRLSYLREIAEMMKTGAVITVIDRQYPLSAMQEAHEYVETGRKKGNLVITM